MKLKFSHTIGQYYVDWSGYAEGDFLVIDSTTKYIIARFDSHWTSTAYARKRAIEECNKLNEIAS